MASVSSSVLWECLRV
jgi:hypothetical protein